jgi:hypothetical protein
VGKALNPGASTKPEAGQSSSTGQSPSSQSGSHGTSISQPKPSQASSSSDEG